jgi:hypothetical protein
MTGSGGISMETADVRRALEWQADHAQRNSAPCTGRLIRAFLPLLESGTLVAARMLNWPGLSLEDAMPLRLAGGFHNLHLTGADDRLGPIYRGELTDQAAIDAQDQLAGIQGTDRLWFCGAWGGYGFHEDGLVSALRVANRLGCYAPWQDGVEHTESLESAA